MKTLGIDVGTNSVGWAIVEEDKIINAGVRIFNEGVNLDKYNKTHIEESKNEKRREARGIRRRYFRYKLRRKMLIEKLDELDMLPDSYNENPFELYELRKKALEEKISLKQLGRILLMINKHRGFLSNRKNNPDEDSINNSEFYKQLDAIDEKIKESKSRTIGEYFYKLFLLGNNLNDNTYEPSERIRDRFIKRKNYEDEFNLIWENQSKFYPDKLNEKNKIEIRDKIIFYVRHLKSQKFLIKKCRFFPNKRVAPKSSPKFQSFRFLQTINNLSIVSESGEIRQLDKIERENLIQLSYDKANISLSTIRKTLKLASNIEIIGIPDKIKGNTTYYNIKKAIKEKFDEYSEDELYIIWEKLHFARDNEWLRENLCAKHRLSEDQAKSLSMLSFETDYCNLSSKAIDKLIPHMLEGLKYSEACDKENMNHSDFIGKDENQASLAEKIEVSVDDPILSKILNPLVKRSIHETIKVINAIIKEYGKPDTIRIELARELNMPKDKRQKIYDKNTRKNKLREKYKDFLREKFGMQKVSKSDLLKFELWLELEQIQNEFNDNSAGLSQEDFRKFANNVDAKDKTKFRLWLECGRISIYTGLPIPLNKLFSGEYEVEHIIPFSKSFDDSFNNKTICERKFNRDKGTKLAAAYIEAQSKDIFQQYVKRCKIFNKVKKDKLLMKEMPEDFRPDQLTNNSYIAIILKEKCKAVFENVEVTNGVATAKLRRFWGLNTILNPENEAQKSRKDHRHHAIDAIVIAFTKIGILQKLSRNFSLGRDIANSLQLEPPFKDFRKQVKNITSNILISIRKDKRLITTKINKYRYSKAKNKIEQKTFCIRGALHEETFYGKINDPLKPEKIFVIKKKINELNDKQIDEIVDTALMNIIKEKLRELGKKPNQLQENEIIQYNNNGKGVPVRSVRIKAFYNKPDTISVKDKNGNSIERHVMLKNNYVANVYRNQKNNKLKMDIISFYDAVKRKLNNFPLVDTIPNEVYQFSLNHEDYILILNDNYDKQDALKNKEYLFNNLFIVKKFSNNKIGYLKHNEVRTKENFIEKAISGINFIKLKIDILGKPIIA